VNYYPFHIGDFAAHTAHLTWEEDIAYRRALDWYYLNEKALPEDVTKVARLIRMPKSVAVIEAVLAEFFVKAEDGWHNKRADQELASMAAKQEQQGAKDEHEAERMKRHRERRAQMFAVLRAVGVVPAWDVPMKELQRLFNENCNAPATDLQREQAVTVNAAATAIPIPTPTPTPTPIPVLKEDSARKRTPPAARPPNVSEPVWHDFQALRKTKRAPITTTAMAGIQAEADKAGICLDAALAYCCAVGWQAFNATWYAERQADQSAAKPQAAPRETFRERDERLGREKWEQMTGRQHPDSRRAQVLDAPATTIATASIAKPALALTPLETTA
jgi:uncharacterized protein YdaU (DUF1376 family)